MLFVCGTASAQSVESDTRVEGIGIVKHYATIRAMAGQLCGMDADDLAAYDTHVRAVITATPGGQQAYDASTTTANGQIAAVLTRSPTEIDEAKQATCPQVKATFLQLGIQP